MHGTFTARVARKQTLGSESPRRPAWRTRRTLQLVALSGLLCACGGTRSRDLECEREPNDRRREICNVIADHLKLSWSGETRSLTPGYLLSPRELPKVFCTLRLKPNDEPALAAMRAAQREPRLAEAAGQLHQLVARGPELAGTRYDPAHPRYVLKGGCPAPYSAQRR